MWGREGGGGTRGKGKERRYTWGREGEEVHVGKGRGGGVGKGRGGGVGKGRGGGVGKGRGGGTHGEGKGRRYTWGKEGKEVHVGKERVCGETYSSLENIWMQANSETSQRLVRASALPAAKYLKSKMQR